MPSKRLTLSIYLLKNGIIEATALKATDPENAHTATFRNGQTGSLHILPTHRSKPSWHSSLAEVVEGLPEMWTNSASALLIVPYRDIFFALSFGYGKSLFAAGVWEEDFGLKVTLNSVDPTKLRSVDRMSFDAIGQHSRIQASREADIREFGLDLEQDMLRAVSGKPSDPTLGGHLTGRDALQVSITIDIKDLPELLARYYEQWQSTAYRARFPWVDQISDVKDTALIGQLNDALVINLQQREFTRLWLSIPELIDWTAIEGFKFRDAAAAASHPDVHIREYLDEVNPRRLDIGYLKRRQIEAVTSDGHVVKEWSVFRCLYAEIERGDDTYLLTNGKWYCVSDTFLQRVNLAFDAIPRATFALPNYNDESEGAYNVRVRDGEPTQFALMDGEFIQCDGPNDRVEFCDLFDLAKHIIHVKRYTGSSAPLSHLFAQALVSATTFRRDGAFRTAVNDILPATFRPVDDQPLSGQYEVVLGIVSKSVGPLKLPFFSRVNINSTKERIQDQGYKVSMLKIQGTRKQLRHMLHDDDAGSIGGQRLQH